MPHDPLTIYLDENHCNNRRVLAALEALNIPTERHLSHFPPGTPDEEWLPLVGKNGWALITTDKRIRHHSNERKAVMSHRVRMFYFSKNDMSGQQMADALVRAIPKMIQIKEKHPPPFFAAITKSGEVHLKEKLLLVGDVPGKQPR